MNMPVADVPATVDQTETSRATPATARGRHWLAGGLLALLVLVAAGIAAYLYIGRGGPPAYRFATVTRGPVTAFVTASGTVNPVISVQVGSQVSGQIKALLADFNSRVTTGQLIARIDPALFETQVAQAAGDFEVATAGVRVQQAATEQAQASLDSARATLESLKAQTEKARVGAEDSGRIADRARRLALTGAGTIADRDTTQAIYDQAQAQVHTATAQEAVQLAAIHAAAAALEVARANIAMSQAQVTQKQAVLDNAKVNLEHTYIRAPVDGTVVLRNVDVGQTVAASLQAPLLFTIAQDLRQMQVDTSVDEADVGTIRTGQRAEFGVDAYPGRVFQGSVQQVRIAPQVVQNVVTYDVVVSAPNPDLALLPGLTANIRIITDHRDDALLVPNAALRYRPSMAPTAAAPTTQAAGSIPGGAVGEVWMLGPEGRPVSVRLKLGIGDGNVTEVLEGALAPGTVLIVGERTSAAGAAAPPGSPGVTGPRL